MAMGRPKAKLILSEAEEAQLSSFARSRSMPAALSLRARIVLACATGQSNSAVARRFACNRRRWVSGGTFFEDRIAGLV